jgi:HEAT repeat protein
MRRTTLLTLAVVPALGLAAPTPAVAQTAFLGKTPSKWVEDLRDGKPEVRRSAAFALGKLGDNAFAALPKLKAVLERDKDAGVRETAAVALGDIVAALRGGRQAWEDLGGALERALGEDPDPRVRRSAAYALGAFGALASPACPALRKALRHDDPAVRQNAAWALGRVGGDVPEEAVGDLCELLQDRDALVRRDAAAALGAIGKPVARAAAKPLLELAGSDKEEAVVRKTAVDALAKLAGPEHVESAPVIYPLLRADDPELARGAAFVLANVGGKPAQEALPVLRKALDDDDPSVQKLAAAALGNIGAPAAAATADLARALDPARDPEVRRNAAVALALVLRPPPPEEARRTPGVLQLIEEHAPEAIPALVQCLKLSEPLDVRQFAAEALAAMEFPANEKAIPAILDALRNDNDPTVRQRCVWALFRITDPNRVGAKSRITDLKQIGAEKPLTDILSETSREALLVRYDAARLLALALREKAPDRVTELLLEMLNNRTLRVYLQTDAAVSGTASEATKGEAAVKEKLGDDGRYMGAQALGWLGRNSKAAKDPKVIDALREAARDPDKKLSEVAKQSLKELGAAGK